TGRPGRPHSCGVMTAPRSCAMVLAHSLRDRSTPMESGDYDPPLAPGLLLAQSWQATVILGAVTLILGLIVSFHPGGSLNVVAVLLGILLICSGIFHLVRIFGRGVAHRIWLGISGLLLIVIGVVLIRHLHLSLARLGR